MKRSIKSIPRPTSVSAEYKPPELSLVGGGSETQDPMLTPQETARLRELLVKRARSRAETGYYRRPEVVRRLVDVLWDEFYSR